MIVPTLKQFSEPTSSIIRFDALSASTSSNVIHSSGQYSTQNNGSGNSMMKGGVPQPTNCVMKTSLPSGVKSYPASTVSSDASSIAPLLAASSSNSRSINTVTNQVLSTTNLVPMNYSANNDLSNYGSFIQRGYQPIQSHPIDDDDTSNRVSIFRFNFINHTLNEVVRNEQAVINRLNGIERQIKDNQEASVRCFNLLNQSADSIQKCFDRRFDDLYKKFKKFITVAFIVGIILNIFSFVLIIMSAAQLYYINQL